MAIANLFNIPGTPEEFQEWATAHATHHLDIINSIYVTRAIAMPQFCLDPFNPDDPNSAETWAYLHQQMHQNQNEILGIAGFDLSSINWQDARQRAAWIQLNANEHLQASNILGIG